MNNFNLSDFIFWLHTYGLTPSLTRSGTLLCCRINRTNITIEDPKGNEVIPLNLISECRSFSTGGGRNYQRIAQIEYYKNNKKESYYLLCADPLRPKHYPDDGGEVKALVNVINHLRSDRSCSLSPNPNERAFVRKYRQQEFDATKHNALISPLEYWTTTHKGKVVRPLWQILFIIIAGLILAVFILAFFFGGITIKF